MQENKEYYFKIEKKMHTFSINIEFKSKINILKKKAKVTDA